MRLWTIQPVSLFKKLQKSKYLYCDPLQAELLQKPPFRKAYD